MAISEKYVTSAGAGAHDGSSLANAFSWAEMITDINAGGKEGNRYNVNGTISRTTTVDTLSAGGTVTSPVIIRGYSSVIGDGYLGRTNNNGPLITTNMPAISYTTGRLVAAAFTLFESLDLTSGASTGTINPGADTLIYGCNVTNSSTNAAACGIINGTRGIILNCDVQLTGASGGKAAIDASSGAGRVLANRVKGGPGIGIVLQSTTAVIDNVVFASTGLGISMTSTSGSPLIYGNTVVGGTTDGIDIITGTTTLQCIVNNCLTDNGGYGLDGVSAANGIASGFNRFRDNSLGTINSATDWIAATSYGHVTSGAGTSDYTNAGGNDYSLVPTSPAKGVGIQAYRDIGALQRQELRVLSGGNFNGGMQRT